MLLLKAYLEIYYLVKSLFYLLSFPLQVVWFYLQQIAKAFWLTTLSVSWIQKLQCPRFGTNLFSRAGRIVLTNSNVHLFFGGALAGVAILFFLYQPVLRQFDGSYYVVFQRAGAEQAFAQESIATNSATLFVADVNVSPSPTVSDAVLETSMPIVTEVAPTPTPAPVLARKSPFVQPQTLPADFVPPSVQNNGAYFSPLRNPPRLMITTKYSGYHPGIDLATDIGTPIYSVSSGYVESIGSTIWAYGNVVYINHGNGVVSLYAHMSRVDVKPGQQVTKDSVIGAVGSTGNSSGPHVHLELHKDGRPFNPFGVLQGL
jgi:murein DD-endopeptidase MepM/ murein hydrolase activator NlpD